VRLLLTLGRTSGIPGDPLRQPRRAKGRRGSSSPGSGRSAPAQPVDCRNRACACRRDRLGDGVADGGAHAVKDRIGEAGRQERGEAVEQLVYRLGYLGVDIAELRGQAVVGRG
jgi:hypothetical protein